MTSAALPVRSNMASLLSRPPARATSSGGADRPGLDFLRDAPDHARQRLAGADLDRLGHALPGHPGHALAPAHPARSPARPAAGGSPRGRSTAAARDVGHQRHHRRARSPPRASASAIASAAGCISAQWNGALTGSSSARLAPLRLGDLDRPLDRRPVARDHHLRRVVVVRRLADPALRGRLGRHRLDGGEVEPEQRRHRPLAHRHRRLHRLARAAAAAARCRRASAIRRRRAPNTPRANARRRRPPASIADALGLERPQRRDRGRHQRRLGVRGQGQLAMSPSQISARQLLAERLVDLLEDRRAPPDRPPRGRGPCRPPGRPGPETRTPASRPRPDVVLPRPSRRAAPASSPRRRRSSAAGSAVPWLISSWPPPRRARSTLNTTATSPAFSKTSVAGIAVASTRAARRAP